MSLSSLTVGFDPFKGLEFPQPNSTTSVQGGPRSASNNGDTTSSPGGKGSNPPAPIKDAMTATDICWMITSIVFTFVIPVWPVVAFFMWMSKGGSSESTTVPAELKDALKLVKDTQKPTDNTPAAANKQLRTHLFTLIQSLHIAMEPLAKEEAPSYGYVLWSWMKSWAPKTETPVYKSADLIKGYLEVVQALPDSTLCVLFDIDPDSKTLDAEIQNVRKTLIPDIFKSEASAIQFLDKCNSEFDHSLQNAPQAPHMTALVTFYSERKGLLEAAAANPSEKGKAELALIKQFMNVLFAEPSSGKDIRDLSEAELANHLQRIWASFSEENREVFRTVMDGLATNYAIEHAGPKKEQAAVDSAAQKDPEVAMTIKRLQIIGIPFVPRLPAATTA